MKEDILEQIVDDYLQHHGYFTVHNVRFKPSSDRPDYVANQDSVASDVDVVGYNPLEQGMKRVWIVSCKSWQPGFDATAQLRRALAEKKPGKRAGWQSFRELFNEKWAEAFRNRIEAITGATEFSYSIAVTSLRGETEAWTNNETIRRNLGGNPFSFLTLEEMWGGVIESITTTPAASEIGRLAQLLKAAKLTQAPRTSERAVRSQTPDPRT
ncbi:MAG TPA: hypothetical protein VHJ34_09410 [Actinomycetota bacterium]|nr:hypothetical protein [Actinomycetota bacterium]